ncbi:hypothetical protein EAG_11370, partial [Camponotus floridanus]
IAMMDSGHKNKRKSLYKYRSDMTDFSREARRYLDERFPGRWIGCAGPIVWPARSPDLNRLNYYLWGHLKSIVYKTSIDNVEILRQRVEDGCPEIRAIPGILEKVRQSMMRRVEACIQVRGSHFEHI